MTQEAGGVHYLFALEIARAQVRSRQPNPIPPNKVPVATCSLRCLVLDEREKQKESYTRLVFAGEAPLWQVVGNRGWSNTRTRRGE